MVLGCLGWACGAIAATSADKPDHQTRIPKLKGIRVVFVAKSGVRPLLAARPIDYRCDDEKKNTHIELGWHLGIIA
jgi:hypothetical protein